VSTFPVDFAAVDAEAVVDAVEGAFVVESSCHGVSYSSSDPFRQGE
jgi:hypothetical protein